MTTNIHFISLYIKKLQKHAWGRSYKSDTPIVWQYFSPIGYLLCPTVCFKANSLIVEQKSLITQRFAEENKTFAYSTNFMYFRHFFILLRPVKVSPPQIFILSTNLVINLYFNLFGLIKRGIICQIVNFCYP